MTACWTRARSRPALAPGEVHVWLVDVEDQIERVVESSLSGAERERAGRITSPAERRRFVVTRGSLRALAGWHLGCRAAEVVIEQRCDVCGGPHGPTRLPAAKGRMVANVSHSGTFGAIALATGGRVGVDIEDATERLDAEQLSRLVLTPDEQVALRTFPAGERSLAFHRGWVRKEALTKAVGLGARCSFEAVEVGIGPVPAEGAARAGELRALAVVDFPPLEGYAGALAVEPGRAPRWWTFDARLVAEAR